MNDMNDEVGVLRKGEGVWEVVGAGVGSVMNILFRKNIAEGGGGGGGGGGTKDRFKVPRGTGGGGRAKAKSKPIIRPTTALEDHYGLRTHIFLSPVLPLDMGEESSGPFTSGLTSRRSSLQSKWRKPSGGRPFDLGHTQVNFSDVGVYGTAQTKKPISLLPVPKAEISQLRQLDKDCFIIPVASLDRFLPAGVPMPLVEQEEGRGTVSVMEVEDPKICLLIHLMTHMESIEPVFESPLALPHLRQRTVAAELLSEVASLRAASEGMLLTNIEKNSEFPFISYYVVNKATTDPREFFHNCRATSLRKFDPRVLRYSTDHTFDLFNEVATIARPPLDPASKRPSTPTTGFIVTLYRVFEGDDREKFEQNWLYWTGARMIYRALPKSVGLRRITLHKSVSSGDKLYILLVECSNFVQEIGAAAALIPPLRARLCGYTGLYTTSAVF